MDNRIEKAIAYITGNLARDLSLDQLALAAGLSKFHFSRLFTNEVGISPLQYINKRRAEYAAHQLIMFPERKHLEVAFECGYSSPAVFARSFKARYGISASEFKKKKVRKGSRTRTMSNDLSITYLPHQKISVLSSNLELRNITKAYGTLIKEGFSKGVGFFIDAPMHTTLEEAVYYAGAEGRTSKGLSCSIEEGYYCYFTIQGDFNEVTRQIVSFKEEKIDPSHYKIESLVGMEKINLPEKAEEFDYFTRPRTLYLKISRR